MPGGTGSGGTAVPGMSDGAIDFSTVSFTAVLPDETTLLAGGGKIGTSECALCHAIPGSPLQVMRAQKSFGKEAGNVSWLYGPHGNYESLNTATFQIEDRGPDNSGFPYYGFEGFGTDPECATNCHDPLGEGLTIAANYAATGNDKIGRVNRPFIGCEACHGGGQNHYGTGAVPVARPNALRCGRCHNDTFPAGHVPHHPEGGKVFEDYSASGHSKSMTGVPFVAGTKDIPAACSRCHTDEGAQAYISVVNGAETSSVINTLLAGKQDIRNAAVVQCRTCHDSHNPETLLGTGASGLPAAWSGEFRTCNACHQLLKADSAKNTASFHDPAVDTQQGNTDRIIADTHYDDPATIDIEGYIVDPASTHSSSAGNKNSGTCRDCHNPHKADNTENKQWAKSAHGGFIATVKDANGDGAVKDATAPAWAHYDFKVITTPAASTDRRDCQRCHTSTGFRNMANSPSAYDAGKNIFVASGNQKEMLYCWGCHTSNKGDLRSPGQFVLPTGTLADGTTYSPYALPQGRAIPANFSGSFICLNCHSGRETAQYIKNTYTDATIAGKTFGTFNSHYLAAGGILLRTIGYEYNGRDYSNSDKFKHDVIGIIIEGTGTNGPCVGCHMKSEESHLFEAVKKDSSGVITDIPALSAVCEKCHGPITDKISVALLNDLDRGYTATLEVLTDVLGRKGIYYNKALYPYFYKTSDPSQQVAENAYVNWQNMNTLGAAFNLNLLAHQPGAFAHNSTYTKRLLYDAIDFVDDGALNNSVQATLNALPASNINKNGALRFVLTSAGGRP